MSGPLPLSSGTTTDPWRRLTPPEPLTPTPPSHQSVRLTAPSPEDRRRINGLIEQGFHQKALDETLRAYGFQIGKGIRVRLVSHLEVDGKPVTGTTASPRFSGAHGGPIQVTLSISSFYAHRQIRGSKDNVSITPSVDMLAATLLHEFVHVEQHREAMRRGGFPRNLRERKAAQLEREIKAYNAVLLNAHALDVRGLWGWMGAQVKEHQRQLQALDPRAARRCRTDDYCQRGPW